MYPICTPSYLNKDAGIERNEYSHPTDNAPRHFSVLLGPYFVSLTLRDISSYVYLHMCCTDDTKSSPDSASHLRWDDPYYDIARHQIVEVAGTLLL